MAEEEVLDEDALQQIYTWIDEIPLSRPKKNISRDFSDGVLLAEIIHHFLPKMVDLHNYSTAHATAKKMDNWNVLSRKCFQRLSFNVKESLIKGAVFAEPGAIELILRDLRHAIENYIARRKAQVLLEKNEIQDEVSSNGYSTPSSDQQNNQYDQFSSQVYGYPSLPLDQHQQTQQQQYFSQGHNGSQYQFSNPPQPLNDIGYQKDKASSPNHAKPRKPVTQATKYSKHKNSTNSRSSTDGLDVSSLRLALEEKEQALLASQETVQILYAKIRRLEHLLHLKDLRINEMKQKHVLPPPTNHHHPGNPPTQTLNPYRNPHQHPPPSHGFQNLFPSPRPPLPQIPRPTGEEPKSHLHR